jgi:hypothetical protein
VSVDRIASDKIQWRVCALEIMIPPKIIRFLEERAHIGFAATRDANFTPYGHRVSGWQIDSAGRTLTAFVSPSSAGQLLESMLDNGHIAVTLEEVGTHETYQIKGKYLSHRPIQPAELDIAGRVRERFAKGVRTLFSDPQLVEGLKASIPTPSLAVDIEVHEVFLQTPGPGAGRRIAPPDPEPNAR